MSQDFEKLVAHFTIGQHCCWIFQSLLNKLSTFFPPKAEYIQLSRP